MKLLSVIADKALTAGELSLLFQAFYASCQFAKLYLEYFSNATSELH